MIFILFWLLVNCQWVFYADLLVCRSVFLTSEILRGFTLLAGIVSVKISGSSVQHVCFFFIHLNYAIH